jgi:acyl carrier protein
MMSDELLAELERVFRAVFNAPTLALREEMTAADVKGWDSLKHVELIMSVESAFKVRFKTAEVAALEDVGALLAKLREKLKQRRG